MPKDHERASLRDVLNYEPEKYLSDEEVALIKSTFRNNPALLAVIRKIMLPTIADPSLPIEEMANDVLLTGVDWMSMPSEHVKPIIQGRMEAIKFVAGGLIKLKVISSAKEENPFEEALRRKKDSAK